MMPTSTSWRAPTPVSGPPTCLRPRTAGSQSAWRRSVAAAKASAGGTGRVTSARASIIVGHGTTGSIEECGQAGDRFETEPVVDPARGQVVVVDVQRADRHLVEHRPADAGHGMGGDAAIAVARRGVHALDLHRVGRPGAEL